MELTKTKLHNVLKRYKMKLEDLDKEWVETCKKARAKSTEEYIVTPTIYEHEQHNAKGNRLFHDLMEEFEGYEIFPKKGA